VLFVPRQSGYETDRFRFATKGVRRMTMISRLTAAFGVGLLASLAACEPPPPPAPAPAEVQRTKQVVATVESVDMTTRQVLLRAANGSKATVVAGPEVRNLPQLRAGDRVTITYQEALAVQMAPAGSVAPSAAVLGADRAAPGQLPGGAVGGVVIGRVTIVSAAPDGTSVTFVGQNGVSHTADVRDPKMQAFVQQLRPGNQVDVGFASEVAVRVDPMK
jgi:hypothetical protein